jgi:glycerol-3-phosphate dehydrogenase
MSSWGGEEYDLIVVGGGIVGAGVARDAALRGLSVVLFEQGDFAGGTSGRTSRMVHGGIRYLEQGELRLVFEASREREILSRLAPHLVRPIPFLFPIYPETGRSPWLIRAGMILYDLLALFRNFHPHRMLSSDEVLRREPGLSPAGLRGGALFYDAQMDDARLCLAVLLSARAAGARLVNYASVEGLLFEERRVTGVRVRSMLRGESGEVRGRATVNATGPWLDRLAGMENPESRPKLRTSQGTHLIVPRVTRGHAVVVTSRSDQRVFFLLPWRGMTLIGTTDIDYKDDPARVRPTPGEVLYLLDETRRVFPDSALRDEAVIARFAGVRPLVNEPEVAASAVSRETEIFEGPGGMVSIIGGKYTLHRRTAQRVVDRVVRKLGRTRPEKTIRSATAEAPLWGGEIGREEFESYLVKEAARASNEYAVPEEQVRCLIGTYGTRYTDLLERIREDRSLLSPIVEGEPEILAQIDHAVSEEMALTLPDLLRRRTSLALTRHRADPRMLFAAAGRMGRLLGWSAERQTEEIRAYLQELE